MLCLRWLRATRRRSPVRAPRGEPVSDHFYFTNTQRFAGDIRLVTHPHAIGGDFGQTVIKSGQMSAVGRGVRRGAIHLKQHARSARSTSRQCAFDADTLNFAKCWRRVVRGIDDMQQYPVDVNNMLAQHARRARGVPAISASMAASRPASLSSAGWISRIPGAGNTTFISSAQQYAPRASLVHGVKRSAISS